MFAFSSSKVRAAAGGLAEAPVPRRSVGAAIRHGIVIGAAATVLQLLLLLALLYACGIIAT